MSLRRTVDCGIDDCMYEIYSACVIPNETGERQTSFLCIVKDCSFNTSHFSLHNQLVNPSSLMLTVPVLTTWELKMASEFGRFGVPPMPV
jgi:hypothetical protein